MTAPQIPTQISRDGKEVWDWAGRFSEHVHRMDRMRNLEARIRVIGTVCGDCSNWMKSRECPREHNVNGYSRGPSMNERKCPKFVECFSAINHRTNLTSELKTEADAHARAALQEAGR